VRRRQDKQETGRSSVKLRGRRHYHRYEQKNQFEIVVLSCPIKNTKITERAKTWSAGRTKTPSARADFTSGATASREGTRVPRSRPGLDGTCYKPYSERRPPNRPARPPRPRRAGWATLQPGRIGPTGVTVNAGLYEDLNSRNRRIPSSPPAHGGGGLYTGPSGPPPRQSAVVWSSGRTVVRERAPKLLEMGRRPQEADIVMMCRDWRR